MRRGTFRSAFVVTVALLGAPDPSTAKGPDFATSPLSTVSELYVMVWDLEDDVQADGLSLAKLRTDVEQMLSRAGIQVVATRDYAFAMHRGEELPPALVVDVHTMRVSDASYVANVELEVWASATLTSNPGIGVPQATLWRAPAVLTTVTREKIDDVYEAVEDMVGKFLDDYWKARIRP